MSYEYDVTIQDNAGDTATETVERVQSYAHIGNWVEFYNEDGDRIAEFSASAIISILRGNECDPDPKQDTAS